MKKVKIELSCLGYETTLEFEVDVSASQTEIDRWTEKEINKWLSENIPYTYEQKISNINS